MPSHAAGPGTEQGVGAGVCVGLSAERVFVLLGTFGDRVCLGTVLLYSAPLCLGLL